MTMQSARDFLERLRADPALAARMAEAASPQERLVLARQSGFDFSVEELTAAKQELPAEDLDGIGAGTEAPSCVPVAFFVSG